MNWYSILYYSVLSCLLLIGHFIEGDKLKGTLGKNFLFTILNVISQRRCVWPTSCPVAAIATCRARTVDVHLLKLWLCFETLSLQQKPTPQMAPSPVPTPHILYNPTQHMLTYAGFCPSGQSLPAYPNYPLPIQVRGTLAARVNKTLFWCLLNYWAVKKKV